MGAFGQVVQAKCKVTEEIVSIKLIEGCFKNPHRARMVLREIMILRKFTEMEDNIFTTKIFEIIMPDGAITEEDPELQRQSTSADGKIKNRQEADCTSDSELTINFKNLKFLFVVMEYVESDFQKLMNSVPQTELSEDHIITILYN